MEVMPPLSFIIADEHWAIRSGLKSYLINNFPEAGIREASNGNEVITAYEECCADIIIVDIRMPKLNGMQTTRILLNHHPKAKVVAFSLFDDETTMIEMFEAGAVAYLDKTTNGDEFTLAINTVLEGKYYALGKIIEKFSLREIISWHHHKFIHLSEREREILLLICKEFSTEAIAEQLHLSANTVQNHRNHLLEKIKVHNTAGLVMYAVKKGWVEY